MEGNRQYQQYQELSINTLTPGERIVLLYEQVILQINRSIQSIGKKDIGAAHNFISKAEKIILYLMDILDLNYPISKELLPIYEFIYHQLVQANIGKDADALQKTLPLIQGLRDTWRQAEQEMRQKQLAKGLANE